MKETTCASCGRRISIDDGTTCGQHVLCPYCNQKFSYLVDGAEFSMERLSYAIAECRKDDEDNRYYSAAPEGARLYIGLVFYAKVFKEGLNLENYMLALAEIETELTAIDWEYLLKHEKDDELSAYFRRKLNEAQDANRTLEGLSKTRRAVPKEGVLKRPTQKPQLAQNPILTRRLAEAEQCRADVVSRERRTWKNVLCGKAVVAAGVLAATIAGAILYLAWPSSPVESPSESAPAVSVHASGPTLQEALAGTITNRIAELYVRKDLAKRSISEIRENQRFFEAELSRVIERGNLKSAEAQAKGVVRLNGAETAMAVLGSQFFNEFFVRYCDAKPFEKADACRKMVEKALETSTNKSQSKMDAINQLAVSYQESAVGELRRSMEDKLQSMKSLLGSISENTRKLKALQAAVCSAEAATVPAKQSEYEAIIRSEAFTGLCELPPVVSVASNPLPESDVFVVPAPQRNVRHDQAADAVTLNASPVGEPDNKGKVNPAVAPAVPEKDETAVEPKSKPKQSEVASDVKRNVRRHKCKSPIKCTNFAEVGHNFCEDHECHSYGCKEHVRTITSLNWAHGGLRAVSSLDTAERKLIKRKCIGQYCSKHCCNRVCPEIKNYKEWWNGYLYWDNPHTEKFFYCDNERLAKSRYCIEHACKVPTCNSCREEYWKFADGAQHQEVVSEINLDCWWYRWNRKWQLSIGPMCRAHSNTDPEAVRPRDTRTPGDMIREKGSR